jgi:hypothetical protein
MDLQVYAWNDSTLSQPIQPLQIFIIADGGPPRRMQISLRITECRLI